MTPDAMRTDYARAHMLAHGGREDDLIPDASYAFADLAWEVAQRCGMDIVARELDYLAPVGGVRQAERPRAARIIPIRKPGWRTS